MITNFHVLYTEEILKILPHNFPFLLVDRVLDFKNGKFLRVLKNISFNEPFFQGHFPKKPIFPGVLILEVMAQSAGILLLKSNNKLLSNESYYFTSIDKARFKKFVQPGDQMIVEIEFIKEHRRISRFKCISTVDDKVVCQALIMCVCKSDK